MTESLTLDELRESVSRLEIAIYETHGTRLTREQFRARLGCCDKTFSTMLKQGRIPPGIEGKWLLSEIIKWERSKALGN